VLSRASLTDMVWEMNFDRDSNVIDVAVRRLRLKLDDPHPHKLLHTVRGMGYVLESRRPEAVDDGAAPGRAAPATGG
jgi:two-component system, OmpR family, copper resistance phosphate regulon response regulator CusR